MIARLPAWLPSFPRLLVACGGAAVAWSTACWAAAASVPVTVIPHDGPAVAIRSWLVAGMFPSPDLPQATAEGARRAGYDIDYLTALGGEPSARPSAGTKIRLPGGGEVTFTPHTWAQDYVDLVDIFGSHAEVLAYLYCQIESPTEQEVYLHVGTNDAGKLWIGGQLVLADPTDHAALKSLSAVRVRLSAGRTPVLAKIDQAGANWGAFVEVYGKTAHEGILAASSPDTVRAARNAFVRLRAELGDPLVLGRAQRDAYALARYYAERVEKVVPSEAGAEQKWDRQRLVVPRYFALLREAIDGARRGIDPYTGKTGMFEAAYLSDADETAQPFTIVVPEGYSAEKPYWLLLDLHGAGGTHERAGSWWASVGPADSAYYTSTIGVSVMGRGRWSGYDGLGENDVLRVIDWVVERYSVDPDRVYLSGGSMGGRGSWLLSSRYPDRFAATWPDMGWPEFSTLPNLLNLPTYVNHGGADWVVPVWYSRLGVRGLEEMGSPVYYAEWPDAGHAMGAEQRRGGFLAWMSTHRRVPDPPHIRIHAEHPRYAKQYWGAIERWIDPHRVAKLEATVLPGNVVAVSTGNVAKARLTLPPRHLGERREIAWLANGKHVVTPRSPDGSYDLLATDTSVVIRPHQEEAALRTRPYAPGSTMNLYFGEPLLVVYGTSAEDDSLRGLIRGFGERAARWLKPLEDMEFGSAPVLPDTAVSDADLAAKNLFLVGGPRQNRVTARLMQQMPIRERQAGLDIFGRETVDLAGRGYAFVYPNPERPARLVFVCSSPVLEFYRWRGSRLAGWGVNESPCPPDLAVETIATVDSANDPRQNILVHQWWFTHDWRLKDVPDGRITRHPGNRAQETEFTVRPWIRATGADFAFAWVDTAEVPIDYDRATASWADLNEPGREIITFDVRGSDLVRFARHEGTLFPWIYPQLDSTRIEPARAYRVVAPPWALWDMASAYHYNPENVELFEDQALIERFRREEWGVKER